jgi:hypothetical protein
MDFMTWIWVGLVTGLFGMAYIVYGRKTQTWMPIFAGIGLCVYPYLVDSLWLSILIGVVLLALPLVWRF